MATLTLLDHPLDGGNRALLTKTAIDGGICGTDRQRDDDTTAKTNKKRRVYCATSVHSVR